MLTTGAAGAIPVQPPDQPPPPRPTARPAPPPLKTKAPPPPPMQPKPKKVVEPGELNCVVCSVECTTKEYYDAHMKGARHAKAMEKKDAPKKDENGGDC